jgi:hypothetical protein
VNLHWKGRATRSYWGWESQQAIAQPRKRRKVIRREHLALDDREVDLHLVEPSGMNGGVDRDDRRPATAKPLVGFSAAVGRAVQTFK